MSKSILHATPTVKKAAAIVTELINEYPQVVFEVVEDRGSYVIHARGDHSTDAIYEFCRTAGNASLRLS